NIARLGANTGPLDMSLLWLKRLKLIGVTFRTRTEEERLECIQACARDMLPFLHQGRVRLPVDRTFAMTDVLAAHVYMKQDQHVGKIVLLVD
ncbi:zinc-binding dehydrogenase, partial [Cupriavidus sp. CP313]